MDELNIKNLNVPYHKDSFYVNANLFIDFSQIPKTEKVRKVVCTFYDFLD